MRWPCLFLPLSHTPERSTLGHFTDGFYTSDYVAISLKSSRIKLGDTAELAHYRVGLVAGVALETTLAAFMPADQLQRYRVSFDRGGLFEALRSGEIDLAIFSREFFIEGRFLHELFDMEIVHTLVEFPRHYAFYFNLAHGELSKLFNRYLAVTSLQPSIRVHQEAERLLLEGYRRERKRRSQLQWALGFFCLLAAGTTYAIYHHRRLLRRLANSHESMQELKTVLLHENLELQRLSLTDPLTGLANRREFDHAFEREFARWQRTGECLSLLMLDLDHFKRVNDHYGHARGDEYLCAVASVLKRHCSRATDLAVRYGGEEFVCLLPDTDGDQAALIAEKIRQAVVALQLPNGGGSPPWLTVSIGVVTMRNERSMELASFKALADERLYMAKSAGRNRISAWVA